MNYENVQNLHKRDQIWEKKYKRIETFTKLKLRVPIKTSSLGIWFRTQRTEFLRGLLKNDRYEKLKKLPIWNDTKYQLKINKFFKTIEEIRTSGINNHKFFSEKGVDYAIGRLSLNFINELRTLEQWKTYEQKYSSYMLDEKELKSLILSGKAHNIHKMRFLFMNEINGKLLNKKDLFKKCLEVILNKS